jgi:hypothetical protein
VPSTLIFWTEVSCCHKSCSSKAALFLCWTHCYKKNTVVITIWLSSYQISISRKGDQEWTIQRHWQRRVHKKQDEGKQTQNNTTQKTKQMSNTDITKTTGDGNNLVYRYFVYFPFDV